MSYNFGFLMMLWSLSHDHGWMISKISVSVATLRSGGLLQGEFEALGTHDTNRLSRDDGGSCRPVPGVDRFCIWRMVDVIR